jgi:beta-glucosidase
MTQADIGSLLRGSYTDPTIIDKLKIGSVLVGGDSCPDSNGNIRLEIIGSDYYGATMENWQKLMHKLDSVKVVIQDRWEISILSGTDAVHGNQHIIGEVLFPHNIGMAATHNKKNF